MPSCPPRASISDLPAEESVGDTSATALSEALESNATLTECLQVAAPCSVSAALSLLGISLGILCVAVAGGVIVRPLRRSRGVGAGPEAGLSQERRYEAEQEGGSDHAEKPARDNFRREGGAQLEKANPLFAVGRAGASGKGIGGPAAQGKMGSQIWASLTRKMPAFADSRFKHRGNCLVDPGHM